jgi:hypothetical protein
MKTHEISDLGLSSYLCVSGYKILFIKPIGRKSIFVFEESGNLERAILTYFNRSGKVDPLSFYEQLRNLKALCVQG